MTVSARGLPLSTLVGHSPEVSAGAILHAMREFEAGGREAAASTYARALSQPYAHPASWSNLSALAVALGDAAAAVRHAQQALRLSPSLADAWTNLGVASWQAGQRRDAAMATHRALQLVPGLESAALNYARMLQAVDRVAQAREVLRAASQANPGAWRLQRARGESARLAGDAAEARTCLLAGLAGQARALDPGLPGRGGLRPPAGVDVRTALFVAADLLEAHGIAYHLTGGTLLALVKDGALFPHDKDVDLMLLDPAPAQLDALQAAAAQDAELRQPRKDDAEVIGLVHGPTGVGIDLLVARTVAGGAFHVSLGWPDHLASRVGPYATERLAWDGRDWPVPAPPEAYLACVYGDDWRAQHTVAAGVAYDRCYLDTAVSSQARTPESLPRALNLGLARLSHALEGREWSKAVAYCAQLLAREELPEVRAVLDRLQAAGHDGTRFDG